MRIRWGTNKCPCFTKRGPGRRHRVGIAQGFRIPLGWR